MRSLNLAKSCLAIVCVAVFAFGQPVLAHAHGGGGHGGGGHGGGGHGGGGHHSGGHHGGGYHGGGYHHSGGHHYHHGGGGYGGYIGGYGGYYGGYGGYGYTNYGYVNNGYGYNSTVYAQPVYSQPIVAQPVTSVMVTNGTSQVGVTTPSVTYDGGEIVLFSPPDTGVECQYTLNGVSGTIKPGAVIRFRNDRLWTIEFATGKGQSLRYTLSTGRFKFKQEETGVGLFSTLDQPDSPAASPAPTPSP